MEKPPSHGGAGGYLPPAGRFSPSLYSVKAEPFSATSTSPSFTPIVSSSDPYSFSNDISRMPDNPPKSRGHRRAHSEILTLPDDINFDSDLGVVGPGADGPSLSDEAEEDLLSVYLDMDKFGLPSSSASGGFPMSDSSNGMGSHETGELANRTGAAGYGGERQVRVRHQHSQSMDGSTNIRPEMLVSSSEEASAADSKKAMSAAKLAELALIDPKRAKRIWANRQSAARSKERKMRYIAELERKVQTLQTEATSLSAQLTLLQRDTAGLTAENNELKLRLQTMEQQVRLQDALNEALREEIYHLKVVTGQANPAMMNLGSGQQFYPSNQSMSTLLTAQQFQQMQLHSQKQQQHFQLQHHHHQQQQQKQESQAREPTTAPSPDSITQSGKD